MARISNNNGYPTKGKHLEDSLKLDKTPIKCRLEDLFLSEEECSFNFGLVTHDTSSFYKRHETSSFYWHGTSPSEYDDPFELSADLLSPSRKPLSSTRKSFYELSGDFNDSSSIVEIPCKVIMIGDPGVGKTSLVQRYVNNKFVPNYKWTVGVDFALKVIPWSETVNIKLQLWDIAGQERFTSMTRVYYRDAHACVIMFDLSQRGSFLNALKWKKDLDQKCVLLDGSPVPCILLANKCDLVHREVDQAEIEAFCREQNFIGWTETSVKQGLMVEESMRFLLDDMVARYAERNGGLTDSDAMDLDRQSNVRLTEISQSEQRKKCAC